MTAGAADAADDILAPVASRNLSPLYANLGIPALREAGALPAGSMSLSWGLHWASHAVRERGGARLLELDGETRRHDITLRAGVGHGVTLELNLPLVQHGGGRLDGLIDDWHAFWGMPDGPRAQQPEDRLFFAYAAPRGFLLDDGVAGIGDAEIGIAAELVSTPLLELAAFATGKLATGDESDFTGTGDAAYAAGIRFNLRQCLFERLRCQGQFGLADVGDIAYAPEADRRALFASLSLSWQVASTLAIVAQLDGHEAVYRGEPLAANGAPVWGTLGLRWAPAPRWRLDALFSEDLAVGAAPDITFLLGVSRQF